MNTPQISSDPILVAQEDLGAVVTTVRISTRGDDKNSPEDLFLIANGFVSESGNSVGLFHTWARDEVGLPVMIARFTMKNLKLFSFDTPTRIRYTGELVRAAYYPPNEENQFTDAFEEIEEELETSEVPYMNCGYVQMPEPVEIPGVTLPCLVDVTMMFSDGEDLEQLIDSFR